MFYYEMQLLEHLLFEFDFLRRSSQFTSQQTGHNPRDSASRVRQVRNSIDRVQPLEGFDIDRDQVR